MVETTESHRRYLRAINNPTRRMILRHLQRGCQTIAALAATTGLDVSNLQWQLAILEYGSCVEKVLQDGDVLYRITQGGEVVNYLDR